MTIAKEKKKSDITKPVVIVLIAFLLVPLMTAAVVYSVNEGFRTKTNELLSNMFPSSVGAYFSKQPTQEELNQINQQIADHYITYEDDRLVDKLLLIQADDPELYNNLLILLNRENSVKMTRVREVLRRNELNDDILQRIFEEIDLENQTSVDELVAYFTSMKTSTAVMEIERIYQSGELTADQLPLIFEKLETETAATYLTYLNQDLVNTIRFRLSDGFKKEIDKEMGAIVQNQSQLIGTAQVLENKTVDELLSEIGSEDQYNIQDLSQIYSQLSLEKGGSVLAKVSDTEFTNSLYENITELEALNNSTGNLSTNLADAAKIYQEYNAKVSELAQVYQRITIQELASIADQMLRSNQVYQEHQLDNGERLVFTQEKLVVDVFRLLKPALVASVMEELDTASAVEFSNKLMVN